MPLSITIVDPAGYEALPTATYQTEASSTAIVPGQVVKRGGTGANFAVILATGEPVNTAALILGLVAKESTHTASVAGEVEVYLPMPGVIYRAKATTEGNLGDGILLDRVTFDVNSGVYTVDENKGDNKAQGIVIIGYDDRQGTVDFMIKPTVTLLGNDVV